MSVCLTSVIVRLETGAASVTESHLYTMTKEVFIFTDDVTAFRRVDGDLARFDW